MEIETYRPLLFSLAYHLLGSVTEAEDVVQDVWVDWLKKDRREIAQPKSYLCRMTANKSRDRLKRLMQERTQYIGPWLPEPQVQPMWEPLNQEMLSLGLLRLLEQLNPLERVVFVLREVFEWGYEEVASILDQQAAACRQQMRRARQKLALPEKRYAPTPSQVAALQDAFQAAVSEQKLEPFMDLLQEEVALYSDGGGKVAAALKPLHGKAKVEKFLRGIWGVAPASLSYMPVWANGELGVLIQQAGTFYSLMCFELSQTGIREVLIVRNPDKATGLVGFG
ncbi:MAG: sigma-70 family RNA polymerase sigma factor [Bacteroidota bacterium]